ncbi:MAG: hypothetical protein KF799_06450 [Bdellovibrionales bacterium]|nr:hypothetical protein [Bdellovibrionales bacterium]
MIPWEVNLVTAFGRGETLAQQLQNNAFHVRVLDFTAAFPREYLRGPGPFPIANEVSGAEAKTFLAESEKLERGLAFWLPDGPLELNSAMTPFYAETRADVKALHHPVAEFKNDWLRRFLLQWASPLHMESWALETRSMFPFDSELGLIPSYEEKQVMTFERFQAQGHPVISCQTIEDVGIDGSRLAEIVVSAGQSMAYGADQWIWCLSSRETEMLNAEIAEQIFNRGIWRPEWSWVSFHAACEAGPWLDGFPGYMVVIGDVFLPWVYANSVIVRRTQGDNFQMWMKVPSKTLGDADQRRRWSMEAETLLNSRLSLAKWNVDSAQWGICPHSPVFEAHHKDWGAPAWKNFEWIAPERLERLDMGARLEREADCFVRLEQWRNDQIKKQGASSDSSVHAP